MKHLKLFESFKDEIDDKKLYRKIAFSELIDMIESNQIKSEKPTEKEVEKLKEYGISVSTATIGKAILDVNITAISHYLGKDYSRYVFKLEDDYWLCMDSKYCYLCDTIDGLINWLGGKRL